MGIYSLEGGRNLRVYVKNKKDNIYEQLLNKAIVKANGRVIYPVGRKQAIRDGMIYQDFYERWELWFNVELDNGQQTTDIVF